VSPRKGKSKLLLGPSWRKTTDQNGQNHLWLSPEKKENRQHQQRGGKKNGAVHAGGGSGQQRGEGNSGAICPSDSPDTPPRERNQHSGKKAGDRQTARRHRRGKGGGHAQACLQNQEKKRSPSAPIGKRWPWKEKDPAHALFAIEGGKGKGRQHLGNGRRHQKKTDSAATSGREMPAS